MGHYANAAAWLMTAFAVGVAATVTGMTAFQRAAATVVVPVTTAAQTFLPIILEPLFLRERWSSAPLDGAPLLLGLAVAGLGAMVIARTRGVGEIVATGSAPGPRRATARGRESATAANR